MPLRARLPVLVYLYFLLPRNTPLNVPTNSDCEDRMTVFRTNDPSRVDIQAIDPSERSIQRN